MTITIAQYFGHKIDDPSVTAEILVNADDLLRLVNICLADFEAATGKKIGIDPDTGTKISGAKGGDGDGGFRLPTSTTGVAGSQHRQANAVDVYDLGDHLDFWLTRTLLIKYGLWREAPPFTKSTPPKQPAGWCHLQRVAPRSGNRSFIPW